MKSIMCMLIVLCWLVMGCALNANTGNNYVKSDTIRHYDDDGRYKGYTIVNKYGMRHYDKQGRFVGTSK